MADIPQIVVSGPGVDTFGDWINITNAISTKLNAFGDYNAVTINGGTINGTSIGLTTPGAAKFTNVEATGTVTLNAATVLFADNQISGDKIAGGTIEADTVVLSSAPTADGHAATKLYIDSFVAGPANIASNAVTTTKILDANVTANKLATNSVTTIKIADSNVTTAKIADDAVTTAKVPDGAITANKLASNAVTSGKIADGAISLTGTKITGVLGNANGGTNLTAPWNAGAFFYSNSSTTMALSNTLRQSSGKIGIGLDTPVNKLHIHEATAATAVYQQISNATTGATGSDGLFIGIDADGEAIVWNAEAKSVIFGTNNLERGRFDSFGRFGVGLTTPQSVAHIHNPAGASYLQVTNNISGSTASDGALFGLESVAGNAIVWHQEYKPLIFATNNQERMRLNENGLIIVNGAALTNPHFTQTTGSIIMSQGAGIQAWNTLKGRSAVTTGPAGLYTFTYVQSGTTLITVTRTAHGLNTGDYVQLDFTSGTAADMGGYVTVINANSFTVIGSTSVTTSGAGSILCSSQPNGMPFATAILRVNTGAVTCYFGSGVFPDNNYGILSGGGLDVSGNAYLALFASGTKNTTQCNVNFTQIGVALRDVTNFPLAFF